MQVKTGLRVRAALFSLYGDGIPSVLPSSQSSVLPSSQSSVLPSAQSSVLPSAQPSVLPSVQSSALRSAQPSVLPSVQSSALRSAQPSAQSSVQSSVQPSAHSSVLPSALYGWPLVYGYDSRIVPYLCVLGPRKRGCKGHFVAAAKQKIVLLRLFNVPMLPHFRTLI